MGIRQGEKGFTLVETIIATALLGLLLSTVTLYYTASVRLWDRSNNRTEVQQQVRVALNKLVSDLQQAQSFEYRPRSTGAWQELPETYTLDLAEGVEFLLLIPQLQEEEPVVQVHYYLRAGNLFRCTGGHNPIAMYITRAAVKAQAGEEGLVDIEVAAAKDGAETRLATSAFFRNLQGES